MRPASPPVPSPPIPTLPNIAGCRYLLATRCEVRITPEAWFSPLQATAIEVKTCNESRLAGQMIHVCASERSLPVGGRVCPLDGLFS